MSSILDHKASFAANEERVPRNKAERIRTMGRVEPRTFSDSTHPFSAVDTSRKNRFQKDYVGIGPGDSFAKGRLTGRDPLPHQNIKYEDDNVRFLATGERLRPATDYDRVPRMFELSTQRIQRLNVFPDGTPRTGFPADLSQEQLMQTQMGEAISDLTNILKQGIPQQGALSEDDFKSLLAGQFKSGGIQSMVFNQEQHKKMAEVEAKARADEIKQLLEEGNVSRGKLLEEFRVLQDQGDITADQLDAIIKLTGSLAVEKDAARRQQIIAQVSAVYSNAAQKKQQMIKDDAIFSIQKRLEPVFKDIEEKKLIKGVNAELDAKTNIIEVKDPLEINHPLIWIEMMKIQSETVGLNSFKFKDPAAFNDTMENLMKGSWDRGITGDSINRERLALMGILDFMNKNNGDLPSYEQIGFIQKLSKSKKYKGFSKADRLQTFNNFVNDINNDIIKPSPAMMTPAKTSAPSAAPPSPTLTRTISF